jgi:hypothetical protein
MSHLPLAGPGARIVLRSGRIVRVRPLNLHRALLLLNLIGELLERVGWDQLKRLPLVPALFKVIQGGPEELAEALSLITGESSNVVLTEFAPADAVQVIFKAWEQEFSRLPQQKLKPWLDRVRDD